ncbi:nucleoside hydrolase [Rhizobium sp. RCAM05973]|uniref:nucleoside hydrolase n=1 Tax=Rhizobium sp. RCAM05973 TaxID=2994066 RepID=UPI0032B793B2
MSRHRIIIDADPGVDDAAAILMALASPEIEVLGISVVAGNVALKDTVANACKIVGLSGRKDVDVHAGASGPLVREQVYGKYVEIGSFDDELVVSGDITPSDEHAVRFIVRTARAAARAGDPITLCAIGPLTNVALALIQHPDVAKGIGRIVSMGERLPRSAIARPGRNSTFMPIRMPPRSSMVPAFHSSSCRLT